jgi:hypothetical protein
MPGFLLEVTMVEKNPRYDNLLIFKPDLSKLRSGDVILTKNVETNSLKGRIQSATIARVTGGNFSHALLCTMPPTLIEAIGDGVSNISAQICFTHDLKHIRVLRYADAGIASRAGTAASRFLGKGYSVKEAVRSLIPEASVQADNDQTFCSALVASAFRAGGAPEFALTNPFKTTPATLEKAKHFADVTEDVFIKILSPNNIEQMSALDGDRTASPMAGQARLLNSYYAKISPLIHDFAKHHCDPEIDKLPTSFFDCLGFIVGFFSACEELPRAGKVKKAYEHLQSIDKFAYDILASGEMMKIIREADKHEEESSQYSLRESFKLHPDISRNDTEGLIEATKQQIAVRSSILNNTNHSDRSLVWAEWKRITQEVVDIQTRRLVVLEEIRRRVFFHKKTADYD